MLSRQLAFEQDKTSIYLRNQLMHHHFSRLDSIKQRKNIYLPKLSSSKPSTKLNKNFSSPSFLKDKLFFIHRDNLLIFKKLDKINRRVNQINSKSEIIDEYLTVNKNTRNKFRELKKNLLNKENVKLKERINHAKSVIDNKIIDNDFQKSKKISNCLRKVKPHDSSVNIYLNRKESEILRRFEKERLELFLKAKENKKDENISTKRKNFSTTVDNSFKYNIFNLDKKGKNRFNIDRKILKKIAYI